MYSIKNFNFNIKKYFFALGLLLIGFLVGFLLRPSITSDKTVKLIKPQEEIKPMVQNEAQKTTIPNVAELLNNELQLLEYLETNYPNHHKIKLTVAKNLDPKTLTIDKTKNTIIIINNQLNENVFFIIPELEIKMLLFKKNIGITTIPILNKTDKFKIEIRKESDEKLITEGVLEVI